jgi:tetratricopeptide (TPR) repeat protein
VADLLSLPISRALPEINLSPQRKKEKILEALLGLLEDLSRKRPVLMVFEDVHWIDPTSRELLDLTVERIRRLPVLLIITFRPEFAEAWSGAAHVSTLLLNRLNAEEGTALAETVAGKALPGQVVTQIAARTDGIPLFVEELTRAVVESGLLRDTGGNYATDQPMPEFAIPPSLHASLLARLDRLGPTAKKIAQIGAAIGRDFSYELLVAVAQRSEGELQDSVARLADAGLLFQRGAMPDATFQFKHALVQDAAYSTLLRGPRRALHAQIAGALESQFPEITQTQPELLAQHFAAAGLIEKSVAYWGRAGHRSAARSALAEAVTQFQKALDQLARFPSSPERQRQKLEFYSGLGSVLFAVKGFAAPETGVAYSHARKLWEQLGSPLEYLQVPYGQSLYHTFRGEFDLALQLDANLLRLSRQRNNPTGLLLAHQCFGRNLMFRGRFSSSRSHLEDAVALYDIAHRSLIYQAAMPSRVQSRPFLAIVLFCLGFPDQARAQSNAAIAEARDLDHRPSLAASLTLGVRLLSLVGDDASLNTRVNELVAVVTEQDFPVWDAVGKIYRGWVKIRCGDVAEGISLLRSGSIAYRATEAQLWMPHQLVLLAQACEISAQTEDALTLLGDAFQILERTGERWFSAELNRHKGELLLRRGHSSAAEELYRTALSIAGEQDAKLWELRAAVSLARLRCDQGRRAEACDLLAPVYGWFTEGFDTPDLKEAKALLDELR